MTGHAKRLPPQRFADIWSDTLEGARTELTRRLDGLPRPPAYATELLMGEPTNPSLNKDQTAGET